MYGPTKRNSIDNNKPRYSKLRASCDTCFLAKVKCSKSRPICSRCLACGADCKYSPSSRAGKPKADGTSKGHRASMSADMVMTDGSVSNRHPSMRMTDNHTTYGMEAEEVEWTVMLGSPDGSMGRRSVSSSSLHRPGDESAGTDNTGNTIFDPTFSWATNTSHPDMTSPYLDPTSTLHYRSKSMNDGPIPQPSVPWYEQPTSSTTYSQSVPLTNSIPNVYLPQNQNQINTHIPQSKSTTHDNQACNCFNACLHAFGALHNSNTSQPTSTSPSPFDVILTVNQKAVETCTTMLNCPICMSTSRTGFSSRTMFLGTILGMIIAIYQDASTSYFGSTGLGMDVDMGSGNGNGNEAMDADAHAQSSYPTPPHHGSPQTGHQGQYQYQPPPPALPLTFGTYRVASEDVRWLQMEIILRDLKKLKELFAKFQEMAVGKGERERGKRSSRSGGKGMGRVDEGDVGMHSAVAEFLCRSLEETTERLRGEREGGGC